MGVPQHEVISRNGLPSLWVLTLSNATPALAFLLFTQSATLGEIAPFCSHSEHYFSTTETCFAVRSECKGL